jgi:hypothetical protein
MSFSEVYRLASFEEVVGNLHDLRIEDDFLIAYISFIRIALPFEMETILRPHLGQKISILKTDIPNKSYLFRVLQEQVVAESGGDGI